MDISPVCKTCGTTLSHLLEGYKKCCDEINRHSNGAPYSTNILTSNILDSDEVKAANEKLIKFLEDNLPNNEALICCRTTLLTHMDRRNPFGDVSVEGILYKNNDIVEELEI